MLRKLTIHNVALIDRAEVEFGEGLNVLSGETGAGKSVILDSIDFVLGAKADKSMVRHGQTECFVRAEFETDSASVLEALSDLDIEGDDVLVVTRRLTAEGKSSIKINGCSVTAAMLRGVSGRLVDVHGQSDHFYLLKESNQLRLLDAIAGEEVAAKKKELCELLNKKKAILNELNLLGGDEGERSRRADILRYQIDEIRRAALIDGEEEELLSLRNRYAHAEKIVGGLGSAREILLSDGGCLDGLNGAHRALAALSRFDEKYGALAERLENAAAEIADISETVERYGEEMDVDEADAERVETRLDEIRALKKKYGGSVAEIEAFCSRAKEELGLLTDSGERREKLSVELARVEDDLYRICLELTNLRKRTADGFSARVTDELKTLNIASARFEVQFDDYTREDVGSVTENGLGGLRFLFSANAGEPLKEMGKIISGGEMSRFMLAIKAQLSSVNEIGTYLFDEIDAGISGKTARVVAEKFCKISRHIQIIAVSHLAQIASFADREFLIEKSEENGSTFTNIREIEGEERVREIARLAGGDRDSEFAFRHAEELLGTAEIYKNSL